ncbi:hypothetical protein HZI73_12060 [Vallitalea pronyensis]|uniref:Uncharacterized protein n=1 Tax=Vallitalea pronyensis TaxID=1348613 RepID=A0A8J8SH22_9FIRM|nr:hypothetical protein [Vallitalea pronyensis]QUI22979.1 hypothetical protein HZI73_12060 [Vallitalea pronyensis]
MTIDGYTIESYITNLTTGEEVSYDSLTEEEKLEVEQRMIGQMMKAIGYDITRMDMVDKRHK